MTVVGFEPMPRPFGLEPNFDALDYSAKLSSECNFI